MRHGSLIRLLVGAAAAASAPLPASSRRLVFLIGPNKTGTRSWAEMLGKVFGLRVLHDAGAWSKASRAHDAAFFEGPYEAFTDGDNFDVAWLMATFPAATFIFNTRALLPWLVSRHFHAQDSTHAFLAGHVKSLAVHNDDATVACWVMQRDASLRRAQEALGGSGRLAVLDITAAETDPPSFFTALQPVLPTRPGTAAPSIPHRGVGHAAALPPVCARPRLNQHAPPSPRSLTPCIGRNSMLASAPSYVGAGTPLSCGTRSR